MLIVPVFKGLKTNSYIPFMLTKVLGGEVVNLIISGQPSGS